MIQNPFLIIIKINYFSYVKFSDRGIFTDTEGFLGFYDFTSNVIMFLITSENQQEYRSLIEKVSYN